MSMPSSASPTEEISEADVLGRIEKIAPIIAKASAQANSSRRLPPELLDALHEQKLFRLLLPKPYGGLEVAPPTFFQAMEAVAKHDASTAWCLCQGNGCAMTAAYLEPEIAQEIWGRDPRAVLAWGPGKVEARVDGDGYRISGTCAFASGSRHATWLGSHCFVVDADGSTRRDEDGNIVIRTMLFPADKATMIDVWDVIGLRGTGSDSFSVTDMFVPHDHSTERESVAEQRYHAPLYHLLAMNLYASGFSGTALGIAGGMVEAFMELAGEKTPRLARSRLRDDEVIQYDFAYARARLGAARAFILSELNDIWRSVLATDAFTIEQRVRIRLAATFGIHEAKAVADTIYDLAGATAIFAENPFEQKFRDVHTVTQQLQGRKSHFRAVGAFLFGHPVDLNLV